MTAPPAYLAWDLWTALGFESRDFEAYYDKHGWAEVWARLLDVVRGPRTPCAEPLPGEDWCVFREGHSGPHYGASDVGVPNDLLAKYWTLQNVR